MLLDWCIGKAASPVKEFYLLLVGVSLYNMIPLQSIRSSRTRRELSTLVNVHLTMYDVMQYPMVSLGDETHNPEYDFQAEPTLDHRNTSVYGSLSLSFRYKWLVRERFSMYSALGAGLSIGFPIPMVYVAPVGIKFGKGKIYGIVEANVSPATTYGMAGIGIRL